MSDSMPGPEIQEQGIQEAPQSPEPGTPEAGSSAPGTPEAGSSAPGTPEAGSSAPAAAAAQAYEPAAPAPLGVQRVPTGDAGVDAQLERLADADHLPADGHLEVYEDVHRGLRDALTALDARPQPSPPYNHRS
ncbi:hypothetical protein ACH492_22530 [Streptomyces sp. NPDC019443]|uniref:hypothetical protein n=1 Tax=Streptomyces sp. NPDC019443 TaxID=3365061 RepID=UPI00379EED4E